MNAILRLGCDSSMTVSAGFRPARSGIGFVSLSVVAAACMTLQATAAPPTATGEEPPLVTKRFGEHVTCKVKDVCSDAILDKAAPKAAAGGAAELYYRGADKGVLMRFDLSAIKPGTRVTKATLVLFLKIQYAEQGDRGVVKDVLLVTDPDKSGPWKESDVCYAAKAKDTPWIKAGDFGAVLGKPIGRVFFRNWPQAGQQFTDADLTSAV